MSFNSELIGLDRNVTIQAYCARDTDMNISTKQVPNYLTKLGYYNVDSVLEHNNFINKMLKKTVSLEHEKMTVADVITLIKESSEYKSFENNLNYRITRAIQLSKYIDNETNDYSEFYNDLTLDELVYLGY